jgi:hypothetical protein
MNPPYNEYILIKNLNKKTSAGGKSLGVTIVRR